MIRTDDACEMARLLVSASTHAQAYDQRADFLLERMAQRLGAKLAVFGMIRIVPGAPAPEPLHARRVSSMSAEELASLHAYYADIRAVPDPALARCVAKMTTTVGPVSVRRADLVNDEEWYASDHVRNCRRPGGVDDELLSGMPASEPGVYYACSFHKPWGEPGFTERDRDLVFLFQTSVGWVFEDLARECEGDAVIAALSARRAMTLAALLTGDSEKQAAIRLGVTAHTVHQHTKALHRALGVGSRGELLARCYALRISSEKVQARVNSRGRVAFPVENDPDRVVPKPARKAASAARPARSGWVRPR